MAEPPCRRRERRRPRTMSQRAAHGWRGPWQPAARRGQARARAGAQPHLPEARKHLGEEVLPSRVEDVQFNADVGVGNRHLLGDELDAARHLVRLGEALARGAEHLDQRCLAHGGVAGLPRGRAGALSGARLLGQGGRASVHHDHFRSHDGRHAALSHRRELSTVGLPGSCANLGFGSWGSERCIPAAGPALHRQRSQIRLCRSAPLPRDFGPGRSAAASTLGRCCAARWASPTFAPAGRWLLEIVVMTHTDGA